MTGKELINAYLEQGNESGSDSYKYTEHTDYSEYDKYNEQPRNPNIPPSPWR